MEAGFKGHPVADQGVGDWGHLPMAPREGAPKREGEEQK